MIDISAELSLCVGVERCIKLRFFFAEEVATHDNGPRRQTKIVSSFKLTPCH